MLQSVWVKTGALQWWCDWKPHKWVDVRVALEQFTGHDGARDSILFIYYVVHEEKKVRGGAGGGVRVPGGGGCRNGPGTLAPRCPAQDSVWHLQSPSPHDRVPASGGRVLVARRAVSQV